MSQDETVATHPGLALKHAREKAGVSLAHISEQTRLSQSRLIALEEADYGLLGGVAYATGYARSYCNVIGVDPKPHVEAFEHYFADKVTLPRIDVESTARRVDNSTNTLW